MVLVAGALFGCQSQSQDSALLQQIQDEHASMNARLDQLAPSADVDELNTRVAALEQQLAMPEAAGAADLAARVDALEAHLEAAEMSSSPEAHAVEAGEQAQAFQVATTLYLLDTAGFHEMDESINQESTIQPEYAGTVSRARRMVALTAWPEDLHESAAALGETLEAYAAALADDDVDAAKPLATQAHEQQHELSHAAGDWLAEHGFAAHEESH
jgi:4-alpha-glucanotransferase